jgi:hypothetical protein
MGNAQGAAKKPGATMTKKTAAEVSDALVAISKRLAELVHAVEVSESKDVFLAFRQPVGKVLGTLVLEIMNPLYAEHPELRPPELKPRSRP